MADVLIPDEGQTLDRSLRVRISIPTALPDDGVLEVSDNGNFLGVATVVSGSSGLVYEYLDSRTSIGMRNYRAHVAYINSPTLESPTYDVRVLDPEPLPNMTVRVTAQAPMVTGIDFGCPLYDRNYDQLEFILYIGINAEVASMNFAVLDENDALVDLGPNVSLSHVQGQHTYYTINSMSMGIKSSEDTLIGQTWRLVEMIDAETVGTVFGSAEVPSCGEMPS